jgi:hypothetical protein
MSQVINENTDRNIKSYLSEEKEKETVSDILESEGGGRGIFNFENKKRLLAAFLLVVAAVLALAYFMYTKGQRSFDKERVEIEIEAPAGVSSGEETVFDIKYANGTNVGLSNVRVSLFIPKGFVYVSSDKEAIKETSVLSWNLGKLSKGESGGIKLFGRIFGEKNSEFEFSSKISYIPDNFNYEFESRGNLSETKIKIDSVPFKLSLETVELAVSGDEIEYLVNYENIGSHNFKNAEIAARLPDGFEYSFSEPEADKKENGYLVWIFNNFIPGAQGKLVIKGNITGNKNDEKEAKVSLKASRQDEPAIEYLSDTAVIKIQEAPIVLIQSVNNYEKYTADKGEELEYRIKFKNISDKEIKGLVINSKLEGNVDFDSLEVENGSYDDKYKITWSAFNVPELAVLGPREEGEVKFKVKVKDYLDIKSPSDRNFIIKNKITVSDFNFDSGSLEIGKTIASSESIVKIKAFLFVKAKGYFNDDGRIMNKGVIPPEVGKETSYTIHWNLTNLFSSVKNLKVVSVLPEGVRWTGNYIKPNGEISLGDESNGTFTPKVIDPNTITDINGGMGIDKMGVGYNWYDETVYKDANHKGLPEGLQVGDTLEFVYNDGNIKQSGYCDIKTTSGANKGHSFYCTVPWEIDLPQYAKKESYKIYKVEETMQKAEEEIFYYNSATREVVWRIPELDANVGILSPAKEVVFQISIVPQNSNIGNTVKIMDEVQASGYDEFTNSNVTSLESGLTTELPDDESIGMEEGIVIRESKAKQVNNGE